jgi:hypothetical protein
MFALICTPCLHCLHTQLHAMLEHFNIQVDNPCVLMDQVTCKKFLHGSDTDRFTLYKRAAGVC